MNNKYLGLLIMALYFGNYHLSMFFAFGNNDLYWDINISIYCIIILLTIEYKKLDNFIEKVFLAVVFNNIYVLIFKKEYSYTMHDIYFIIIFTMLQYIKNTKFIKKWLNKY